MIRVITLFGPRVGLREGSITGCELLISVHSDVHAGPNHRPLGTHQTSLGCRNMVLDPPILLQVRP